MSDEKILALEKELNNIKWDIIGLGEVRRTREHQVILKSGHILHYKGNENSLEGRVGLIINRKHIHKTVQIEIICLRVICHTQV